MICARPPLFRKRHFEPAIIVTCVRWYLRFCLSLRDVEELILERGLSVDHTTIWRWVQRYGQEVYRSLRGAVKRKSSTWHMDETFVRIAGKRMYLFRAVDSQGQTVDFYLSETRDREAAKLFLKKALANTDNRPPHVFARDGLRSYAAAIRELQEEGQVGRHCRNARGPTAITGSNRTTVISSEGCVRCKGRAVRPSVTTARATWNAPDCRLQSPR